jgi:peptidylamidoglycolate lyase
MAYKNGTETYEVVRGWPTLPDGFSLGQVTGVGIASSNRVFVFHRAENSTFGPPAPSALIQSPAVLCFDGTSGELLYSWGKNQFLLPHGLRVDAQDRIWLTDTSLHQVFAFTPTGRSIYTLGTEGVAGNDASHFDGPTDVAFAPDGCVYVADGYGNSRIAKFAPDGEFLFDWGTKGSGPGELMTPHSISVDRSGRVYVASRGSKSVHVFDETGNFLEMWRSTELGTPWAVTVGPDNLLYVADGGVEGGPESGPPFARNKLLKLDLSGQILATWSRFGSYDGQLYWAHDVAVGEDGAVYVGDVACGMRVQKFGPVV